MYVLNASVEIYFGVGIAATFILRAYSLVYLYNAAEYCINSALGTYHAGHYRPMY